MQVSVESRCIWQSPHKPPCVDAGTEACYMVSSLNNQATRGGHGQPDDHSSIGRYWKTEYWTEYGQRIVETADKLSCPLVSTIIDEIQRVTSLKSESGELY